MDNNKQENNVDEADEKDKEQVMNYDEALSEVGN